MTSDIFKKSVVTQVRSLARHASTISPVGANLTLAQVADELEKGTEFGKDLLSAVTMDLTEGEERLRVYLRRMHLTDLENLSMLSPWFPDIASVAEEIIEKKIPPFRP